MYGYIFRFDEFCPAWDEKCYDYNDMFVGCQFHYFQDMLAHRGYVFVRDILEALGIKITKASVTAGWKRDDGLIDFKLTRIDKTSRVLIQLNIPHNDIRDIFED